VKSFGGQAARSFKEKNMSQIKLFRTQFQIVKPSSGVAGPAFLYRKPARIATVSAASNQSGDIVSVLTADLPALAPGENYEILSTDPIAGSGSEGNVVYA
jgi:hypothetical protein